MTHPNPQAATPCAVPAQSAITPRLAGAHFHDCYRITVADASVTALGHFLHAVAQTPGWVNALMSLRNRMVQLVGLKDLGGLGMVDASKPEAAYQPGDRVGIFTLIATTPDEVLLGDKDKHLEVTLSVLRLPVDAQGQRMVAVSTVVQVHNWLGHLYMLPVAPIHRRIVPAVLAKMQA